ncbi:MAG TPA: GNAT family protein, partial [Bryobacteraceae bacterium]|nr:GNAT family protein [Bryobacteraceae bacterium]
PAMHPPGRLTTDDPETVLDPVCLDDVPALYAAIDRNRNRLREWLAWVTPDYGIEHTRRFVADRQPEHERRTALTCAIRHREEIAGAIGLHAIDALNRAASIGYWIDRAFSGRGVVTSACRALVTSAFREYGLHRVEIRCATGNHRSCAIPRRLGFTEEGVLRDAGFLEDRWVDLRIFSILEQEWR